MMELGEGARVLVVGGTGMLGRPVAASLDAAGYRVRVLSRTPERVSHLPGGVEVVAGDVADPASLRAAISGCAGVHISLKGGPTAGDFERVEHRGTRAVVEAAKEAGVQRVSYLSGYTIAEHTLRSPESRAKFNAERCLRESGLAYTVFRATWFMESLPLFVREGTALLVGRQPHLLHWIAAADFGAMVAASFRNPAAANRTLYTYGPEAMTMRAALDVYRHEIDPQLRIRTVPPVALRVMGWLTANRELVTAAGLMAYYDRHGETGDAGEANRLLGGATTTLSDWCRRQRSSNPARLPALR
jgi:uncharacterized protein YbjT (DUF2867 family)